MKEILRERVMQALNSEPGRFVADADEVINLVSDLWSYIERSDPSANADGKDEGSLTGSNMAADATGLFIGLLNQPDVDIISLEYPSLRSLFITDNISQTLGIQVSDHSFDLNRLLLACDVNDRSALHEFLSRIPFSDRMEIGYRFALPEHKPRRVLLSVNPVRDHTDDICRLDIIIHDVTEQKSLQDLSARLKDVFLNLGTDYQVNINVLTALLGELFGATCALYNRLDEGLLCSVGVWSAPADYKTTDKPEGHICYDVIRGGSSGMLLVRDLDKSGYAETDPNVKPYKLKTYIGKAVYCDGEAIGSLCAVFQDDFSPVQEQVNMLDMIANAIGVEESRLRASREIVEADEKLMVLINSTPDIICFKDGQGRWMQANDSILNLYCLEGVDYYGKTEPELAGFTAPLYKDAFRNCGASDELAWENGNLTRAKETIPDIHGEQHIFDVIKIPLYNADGSRKGLVVYGRDITPIIEAENLTRFLNESALEFLEMEDSRNIYEFIGERIYEQAGKSIVMVTSFDESTQQARLESLHGVGHGLEKLLKLLNRHPVGMQTYLSPERKRDVLFQKLTFRKDVYELMAGAVTRPVAKAIEAIFSIGTIYEMGFARHDMLLGDVTIITPKNQPLENTDAVEAFIKLAAVALHRRLVHKDLLESEESYRGLFNSISSAVYIQDREGKFLDVNDGAVLMYGYPKDRFIGHSPEFLSAPGRNDSMNIPEILAKTFEGSPQVTEFWGKRSNGDIFPKEVRFYKGKYFGNEVVIVIANEITERYNMISQLVAAKEIAESNLRKTSSIISAFPDSIFIINREGRLLEFFSNDPDDALVKHKNYPDTEIETIMPESISSLIMSHLKTVLETAQIKKYEYELPSKYGRRFFEARMVKLSEDKVLAVVRNTTERMELMEELRQAKERAEESDRLKTSFLHNISHEIRTPMNGIVGFSNLLTQPGINPEDVSGYNEVISRCSDQLLSIINDIVNIATLEAGQEKVREVAANVNEIMRVVHHQLASKASEKNLELSVMTSLSDAEAQIMADETKLNQILSNLLNNAIKFTDRGTIALSCRKEGRELIFCCEDSGIGIPEEMHEVVFERFRQVNINPAYNAGGTGLGLSISRSYVELMGGKLWLESVVGEGSRFYFTIPYKKIGSIPTSGAQPDELQSLHLLTGKTILIVEDEPINYTLLEKMLQGYDLKLIGFDNGYDAVDYFVHGNEADVILMDMKMAGMDGFETTKEIRRIRPDVVIIAQSALALSGDREKAIDSGCNDYIAKPIRKDELLTRLIRNLA